MKRNVLTPTESELLYLGRQGENKARELSFSIADWQNDFGQGTVVLLHKRCGDQEPYPVAVTISGSTVTWLVTNADTAKRGIGVCELQYVVGDVVVKSAMWATCVVASMEEPGEAPTPQSGWVEKLLQEVQAVALPKGGKKGQALLKNSDDDYDGAWGDVHTGESETTQPDWNENDPASPAYVKNRPGGYTSNFGVLYDRTVTLTENEGVSMAIVTGSENHFDVLPEASYIVIFNGTEYIVEPVQIHDMWAFGCIDAVDSLLFSDELPFVILLRNNEYTMYIVAPVEYVGETHVKILCSAMVKIPRNLLDIPAVTWSDVTDKPIINSFATISWQGTTNLTAGTSYLDIKNTISFKLFDQIYIKGYINLYLPNIHEDVCLVIDDEYSITEESNWGNYVEIGCNLTASNGNKWRGFELYGVDSVFYPGMLCVHSSQSTKNIVVSVALLVMPVSSTEYISKRNLVPVVTAEDNGKVLGVVDGALAWVDPSTLTGGAS